MQRLIRKWNCGNCGRSNRTEVALDGTVKCEYCVASMKISPSMASGDRGPSEESEKRESFDRLREQYVEARKLVPPDEPHSNLEWILGGRRDIARGPLGLETKTVELAALWLEDLAVEVDNRPPSPPAGDFEAGAGESTSQSLRDAAKRFLLAFGVSPPNRLSGSAPPRLEGGSSR